MEKRHWNSFELRKADDGSAVLNGYAVVWDELSSVLYGQFRERVERGAFAGSLTTNTYALWNHNTDIVLGSTKAGTLQLDEDARGLRVEIAMPATRADLTEAVARGDVDQMSFAFDALEDSWEKAADGLLIRTLRKAELYEVSPVPFPAYPQTTIAKRGNALGDMPEIPPEFRRTDSGNDAERARARLAWKRRLLDLAEMEE